jgi:hypothetical protein
MSAALLSLLVCQGGSDIFLTGLFAALTRTFPECHRGILAYFADGIAGPIPAAARTLKQQYQSRLHCTGQFR